MPWFNATIPPGELLGMADFDLDPIVVNEPVWTSWRNHHCPGWTGATNQCPGPNQMIFSPGNVTKIESGGVYGADGVVTDQLLAGGGSGAGIWRQSAGSAHRLVSSGFTNGPCGAGQNACSGHKAATIRSALQVAMPLGNGDGVNNDLLVSLGLAGSGTPWTTESYLGLMDSDQNGFFDGQERLDDIDGIRSQSSVWLGFESQTCRVSMMSYTDVSSEPDGLAIELWAAGGTTPVSTLAVPTPATSTRTMFSGELQTDSAIHAVKIRVRGQDYKGSIATLTLIRQGSANRFDTHSDRLNWRNDTTGARARSMSMRLSALRILGRPSATTTHSRPAQATTC